MAVTFPIFMDAQSTTPADPRVVEAMLPYFTQKYGHPASRNHPFGWEAEAAVDTARSQLAALIGARDPKEIVFTSGGTESINLALKGVAEMYREKGNHIVTTVIEQPPGLDGPKGIGALYVRRKGPRVRIAPIIDGGGHERGMRSGTLPVPLIVGLGKAAEIAREVMPEESVRLARLRDKLQDAVLSNVDEAFLNGNVERRLPHNLNISFAYVEGESVLMGLNKECALSSGSACTSSTLEPSYVIAALGASAELAHSSIRFSLHRFNTEEEVDWVGRRTIEVIKRLREMSPLYELAKEGVDLKSIQWKAE